MRTKKGRARRASSRIWTEADEAKHPRGRGGKFARKGTGAGAALYFAVYDRAGNFIIKIKRGSQVDLAAMERRP